MSVKISKLGSLYALEGRNLYIGKARILLKGDLDGPISDPSYS
jgi:hypothetical protein